MIKILGARAYAKSMFERAQIQQPETAKFYSEAAQAGSWELIYCEGGCKTKVVSLSISCKSEIDSCASGHFFVLLEAGITQSLQISFVNVTSYVEAIKA